jgi:hypothetical protein
MYRVERVVDIERYAPGNLVKRLAIKIHHGATQAQQGARSGRFSSREIVGCEHSRDPTAKDRAPS